MIAADNKIWKWILKLGVILLMFFQIAVISVSASPIIFFQNNHTGILETYTCYEIASSICMEDESTIVLRRVLSKNEAELESEILVGESSVVARSITTVYRVRRSSKFLNLDGVGNVTFNANGGYGNTVYMFIEDKTAALRYAVDKP